MKDIEIAVKNYMIVGTKVKQKERHMYSGTSNAIDSYEIPKSFKKNTLNFVRTHANFQTKYQTK